MLAILVPSRGRPQNLKRLTAAVESTTEGRARIFARIDDDDRERDRYLALNLNISLVLGPRIFFGRSVNELAAFATRAGATRLAMFGDDVVPETPGWDRMLIDALGDRLGVAYGSDGLEHLHGPDLPTHYVTQTEVYRRLGWLVLPTLRHLFADNVAREIGKGLSNFQYIPEAKLPHLHPWAHPEVVRDQTYREANDKRRRRDDKAAFELWRNGPGYQASMRLLGALKD